MNVLVVEDDPNTAKAIEKIVRREELEPHLAPTVSDALRLLEDLEELSAAIIDICLPDGSGIDVLRSARRTHPDLSVVMLTAMLTPNLINEATGLGAQYALKPFDPALLCSLLRRWQEQTSPAAKVEQTVREAAIQFGLTPRETEILVLHTEGQSRLDVIDQLGVAPKTYANHVTNLLQKADAESMSTLVIRLLLAAARQTSSMLPL